MKRKIIVLSIASISVIALFLIGWVIHATLQTDNSKLPPLENPKEIYEKAISFITPIQDTVLNISVTNEMSVANAVFSETSEQTVQYDSQDLYIHLQETHISGSHNYRIEELFINDTVYTTVNDSSFIAQCSKEEYTKTLIPAVVLSTDLYQTIGGVDNKSNYTIHFSDPIEPEKWLADTSVTLLEANGTATISYDGKLENSTYTAAYIQDGITFKISAYVEVKQADVAIQPPTDTSMFTPIASWEAPRTLERACGYLMQCTNVSSSYNDSIYFEAFGDLWEQSIRLDMQSNNPLSMEITTNVRIKNDTKQGQETTYSKKEQFQNGQYLVSNNEEQPIPNQNITAETVYTYIQNRLISTIILPQDIASADISEDDDTLRIHFTGTNTFGNFLLKNACEILYNNTSLADNINDKFTIKELNIYLEIESLTGLPVASGIELKGNYKKDGIPYQLLYKAEQNYNIQ